MEDDDLDELTELCSLAVKLTADASTPESRKTAAKRRAEAYKKLDEVARYVAQLRYQLDQAGKQSNWLSFIGKKRLISR